MTPKPLHYICLFVALFAMVSCKELIEPSIQKRPVNLLAPGQGFESKNYNVTFWWDDVEDALQYRLQIVTPGFDNIGALFADTLVKGSNKITLSLTPGVYEWRLRAENGSSETVFSQPRKFTIVQSSIGNQAVQLTAPTNGALTNQQGVTFQWGSLYGATTYRLQIDTNNFADTVKLIYNHQLPGLQFSFSFPRDQQYQWRVRAENDTARAQWSTVRTIRFDHTPPGQVTLSGPGKAEVVALPVSLQWNSVATASVYKLYVFKGDSTTNYNNSFPVIIDGTNRSFNLGNPADRIYWKVSALDAVGNEGQASVLRNFVVK
ncbi:hypothetical protein IDJ77_08315 [Mucilaginibacter sp. ZT4R22]|uniref:Fibronectin type-III domain-containing protein n=1 Tax=Mucilaginibacter pankratovii TaxID=2772110 RepID=A0ABR7WNT0_9SPHI|nr:hypothetical protein [Mucilaginibacter pankratovii]MBD1363813.1 hypothetical protein [Mucilaginibacter pankratovii]